MFKTKKVRELESVISSMEAKIDQLTAENEKLKSENESDRVCGGYCQVCENAIKAQNYNMFQGSYTTYECKLGIKCKDFKEVKA